jgi:hypothetical protein
VAVAAAVAAAGGEAAGAAVAVEAAACPGAVALGVKTEESLRLLNGPGRD